MFCRVCLVVHTNSQSWNPRLVKDPGPMEVSKELDHPNILGFVPGHVFRRR